MNDLYEHAMFLKSVSKVYGSWTIEQILCRFDWYILRKTGIFIRNENKLALILARFVYSLEEGIKTDVHFPLGDIVWVDYLGSNDSGCLNRMFIECISRWKPKRSLAFHRFESRKNLSIDEFTPERVLRMWRTINHTSTVEAMNG